MSVMLPATCSASGNAVEAFERRPVLMTDPQEVRDAATVVLLRDVAETLEVLLIQRGQKLAFHGGAWAFPGGRVESADRAHSEGELETARRAGTRETHEEAGLQLAAADLVPLSHWTTPPGRPRRFATWFFLARASEQAVQVDGGETQDHQWMTPQDALQARRRGEIQLPPPTFVTLQLLQNKAHATEALAWAREAGPSRYLPRVHKVDEGEISLYQGDAAYAGGELGLPGPRHRLLMLESGWNYLSDGAT
jgi:8-oxo-dGTP pyrophosphatase MutT (NUDIX family)